MSDSIPKKCFIIMPFSDTKSHDEKYWNAHFEKFLKPVIEEVDDVEVSRSQPLRGGITSEIVLNLIKADIVVADLTDHNPNVFWELGVRLSMSNGTITIAEKEGADYVEARLEESSSNGFILKNGNPEIALVR